MRYILSFFTMLFVCQGSYSVELFGTVDAISGSAYVIDESGKSTFITVGLKIYERQTINSEQDGEVHLVTEDGGIIALRPNTFFRVDEYKAEGKSTDKMFMSLLKGTVRSITGWVGKYNNSAYLITTPTATIGIRGTDHETTVIEKGDGDEAGTYDNVNEGSTILKTSQGTAEVTPGKFAFAPRSRAVAPLFLAQRPHFFANRRLRIEERIQQRKDFMHTRLEKMREERIKNPRSIRGIHFKEHDDRLGNKHESHRERILERRKEFREHRSEQFKQTPMAHPVEGIHNRSKNSGDNIARENKHREPIPETKKVEKKNLQHRERREHTKENGG